MLPTPIKILVVDDHYLVRRGLVSSLGENAIWTVCGEATNGREAISEFLRLQPDLILMDISMPVMNGTEATKEIRRLSSRTKIVILSMHDSPQIQGQARQAGAELLLADPNLRAGFIAEVGSRGPLSAFPDVLNRYQTTQALHVRHGAPRSPCCWFPKPSNHWHARQAFCSDSTGGIEGVGPFRVK